MGEEPTTDATITVDEGPGDKKRGLIGRTLGAFTVIEQIGQGGGGDVYRADQPELARSAVIKVMRSHARASTKRVERFLREARLASRLDHPYAAHVYAFGAEPDDLLWIAMEHVRGSTLTQLIEQRGRIPLSVFAPFFERLCEVVRSAHELDIIHRDIKPSNVMVIERAGQLLPKLLDFGVAKGVVLEREDGRSSDPALTGEGVIVGTPTYMAPEQWVRPEAVDHRSDIYALGVLAYRCVTGHEPFDATTRDAIMDAHLNQDPPRLGVGPPALDEAIRRALAKLQDNRWSTATDFSAAVRKAIGGSGGESVPPLDARVREMWMLGGPQPFAEAIATVADASTTVEADHAVRDVVDIACRWLAAIALAKLGDGKDVDAIREAARSVVGHADAATWLRLAKAAAASTPLLTGFAEMFGRLQHLEQLAERVSQTRRSRNPTVLREDVGLLGLALDSLTPLLEYRVVVGGERGPELWMGRRTTVRERVVVWDDHVAPSDVVLIDVAGKVVLRFGPLVRAHRPLPHGDVELFLIASAGRGVARLAATPWGYELEDADAARLLDRIHGHDTSSGHAGDDVSPYPGLAPYGTKDAKRYFGREREVDALANRLVRAARVAVLGPSGAGKSSFLNAGLQPRLVDYRVVTMRPGREPFVTLGKLIECEPSSSAITAQLQAFAARTTRGVVLIVDQLEELVTLADSDMRMRFAELLGGLGGVERIRVVVALREDFASMLESTDGLRDRFEPFVIGAPAASSLRRILVEPARRAGFAFEEGVVDDVVAEIEGRAAALPLVAFTAARLWERRDLDKHMLTRRAYNDIGGVSGAIATYADEVYGSLGRREQTIARTLFGRLVAPDGTRVPLSRRDLDGLGDGARAVIERLIEARLLSTQEARDGGDEIVEPIHECLAESWPRLVRWRSEDAADRALLVDLRAAARRWEASSRGSDQLWRGSVLEDVRRLAAGPMLLASERAFATASLTAAQRGRQRRRALFVLGFVAISATAGSFAYLSWRADRAAASANRRLTESLVAHGRRELGEGRNDEALAYFGEALRRGSDSESLRLLVGLASLPWNHQRISLRDQIDQVTWALDNSWIATANPSGHVTWWSSDGTNRHDREFGTTVDWIATNADSKKMLVLIPGKVTIIDVAGAVPDRTFAVPTEIEIARIGPGADDVTLVQKDGFEIVDFDGHHRRKVPAPIGTAYPRTNADASAFVIYGDNLTHVDTITGEIRVIYAENPNYLKVSEDRRMLAFIDDAGAVHTMTFQGTDEHVIKSNARAVDLALSRDGRFLAVIADRTVTVYSTDGVELRTIPLGNVSWRHLAVDGDDVWVGGEDGMLRHWQGDRLVAAFTAHRGSISMIAKVGTSLITSAEDGSVAAWDPDATQIAVGDEVCPGPYAKRTSSTQYQTSVVGCDNAHGYIVGIGGLAVPIAEPFTIWQAAASPQGRIAFAREKTIETADAKGVQIHKRELAGVTGLVFSDEDTVIVADGKRLQRWTLSTDQLAPLLDNATPAPISALAWTPSGLVVGDEKGTLIRVESGRPVATAQLGLLIRRAIPSSDGQWLVIKLDDGSNRIVRTSDLGRVSDLPRGGDVDAPPAFDPSGEFLVRAQDGGLSIFERRSGDLLVTMRELAGSIDDPVTERAPETLRVMVGGAPGILTLHRDRRPVAEILHDIECHVPLRVEGVTLREVSTVTCK